MARVRDVLGIGQRRTLFERREALSDLVGSAKGVLNSRKYRYNEWLEARIKDQAQLERKAKFFGRRMGDLSAAPDTTGKRALPPQTIPEGLAIITQARRLLGSMWGVEAENILSYASSASGVSEAVLSAGANRESIGPSVIVSHFGAFSDRTRRQAGSLNLKHEVVKIRYGAVPKAEDVLPKITQNTTMITLPHLETGTAQEVNVNQLIRRVGDYCQGKGWKVPIIAFDATSSRGTIDFREHRDVPLLAYFSTPKTTGAPPIISHLVANDLALSQIIETRMKYHEKGIEVPFYFDVAREASHQSPKKFLELAQKTTGLSGAELHNKLTTWGYNVDPKMNLGRAHFTQGMWSYLVTSRNLLKRHMEAAEISHATTRGGLQTVMDRLSNSKRRLVTQFRLHILEKLGFEPYGERDSRSIMLNGFVPPEGVDNARMLSYVRRTRGIIYGLGYGGVRAEDWSENIHPRVRSPSDIFRLQDYLSMHSFRELLGFSERLALGAHDHLRRSNRSVPPRFRNYILTEKNKAIAELEEVEKRIRREYSRRR